MRRRRRRSNSLKRASMGNGPPRRKIPPQAQPYVDFADGLLIVPGRHAFSDEAFARLRPLINEMVEYAVAGQIDRADTTKQIVISVVASALNQPPPVKLRRYVEEIVASVFHQDYDLTVDLNDPQGVQNALRDEVARLSRAELAECVRQIAELVACSRFGNKLAARRLASRLRPHPGIHQAPGLCLAAPSLCIRVIGLGRASTRCCAMLLSPATPQVSSSGLFRGSIVPRGLR
jgi:hypothetical protein